VGTNAALEGLGHLPDDERRLLAEVAEWPEHRCWAELTQPVLARLTAERGIDFATTLLYDRLRRSEQHGPFIRRVDEFITRPPLFAKKMDVLLAVALALTTGSCHAQAATAGCCASRRINSAAVPP
jgi:hypothetical protein